MNTLQIILLAIYVVSFIGSATSYIVAAKTSDVARMLGKNEYIFQGIIISFVPLLNTVLLTLFVWQLFDESEDKLL